LVKIPLGAPIITPPASVALRMSYIENFYLTTAVIINVPKQLPVKDRIVLLIIKLFSYGCTGKKPALNEGQNIHKNKVPIIPKIFEL